MRYINLILISFILFGCQGKKTKEKSIEHSSANLKALAFEEINIEFIFNSNNPTFGDLFLITGSENTKRPPKNRQFEKLDDLGFSFIDGAYYGIKNDNNIGDGVTVWLFPIRNSSDFHAPFDSILMEYSVLSNPVKSAELVKKIFFAFKDNLDVKIIFEDHEITDYKTIENRINKTINLCRTELNIEPGSDKALRLVWGDKPLPNKENTTP